MGLPKPVAPASFVGCDPFELIDADDSLRKDSADLQLSSHGDDAAAQRADVHVGPASELGNRRLIHVECPRKFLLRPDRPRYNAVDRWAVFAIGERGTEPFSPKP